MEFSYSAFNTSLPFQNVSYVTQNHINANLASLWNGRVVRSLVDTTSNFFSQLGDVFFPKQLGFEQGVCHVFPEQEDLSICPNDLFDPGILKNEAYNACLKEVNERIGFRYLNLLGANTFTYMILNPREGGISAPVAKGLILFVMNFFYIPIELLRKEIYKYGGEFRCYQKYLT